jgi:hypothetical protein
MNQAKTRHAERAYYFLSAAHKVLARLTVPKSIARPAVQNNEGAAERGIGAGRRSFSPRPRVPASAKRALDDPRTER